MTAKSGSSHANVAGIVLSAGASRRMGQEKALLLGPRHSFLQHVVQAFQGGGCGQVVVVARQPDSEITDLARSLGAEVVCNPGGGEGQLDSLRHALRHLQNPEGHYAQCPDRHDAFVFSPVDFPLVTAATVDRLLTGLLGSQASIAVPAYRGERGHPVAMRWSLSQELLDHELEEGARGVVRKDHARVLQQEVDDPGVISDIDTPERYAELLGHPPKAYK